jgi:hypothetical protein
MEILKQSLNEAVELNKNSMARLSKAEIKAKYWKQKYCKKLVNLRTWVTGLNMQHRKL